MRLAVVLALALAVAACSGSGSKAPDGAPMGDAGADAAPDAAAFCPAVSTFGSPAPTVAIDGDDPAAGIFDPSVVYAGAPLGGVVAYSAVPDQMTIRTHIAIYGPTWGYDAEANQPETNVTIASTDATECPGGACTGNLISEVPSLVYDADDPDPSTSWKLFTHRYLVGANVALHYRIGTITLQTAPRPAGPWTAPAKWIGWNSPASYSSTGVQVNASTLAGTADCLALTEPGAIWLPGVIDLAVGCVYLDAGTPKIRIELLRSTDHAASFTSVGTLVGPDDTACLTPGASINAPDLFVTGGTEYLSATPSDANGYHGCLVFTIDDPTTGHVARDAMGRAIVHRVIAPASGQFSGACTYSDQTGYMLDLGFFGQLDPFRIAAPPSGGA